MSIEIQDRIFNIISVTFLDNGRAIIIYEDDGVKLINLTLKQFAEKCAHLIVLK